MNWRKTVFCLLGFFFSVALYSQGTDSTAVETKVSKPPLRLFSFADPHQPRKATIYAAVIPGLGQAYNRKWLKIPIVWGIVGGSTWFMLDQRKTVRDLNSKFRAQYASGGTPSSSDIDKRNQARRFRDFGILAMTVSYFLQIVDATVDAHFYKLDLNQSLGATVNATPQKLFALNYRF